MAAEAEVAEAEVAVVAVAEVEWIAGRFSDQTGKGIEPYKSYCFKFSQGLHRLLVTPTSE